MKTAYYFIYYVIHKLWNKVDSSYISTEFQADVTFMMLQGFIFLSGYGFISVALGTFNPITLANPIFLIGLVAIIGSTLYLVTFSKKWKQYFARFDSMKSTVRATWMIISWLFIIGVLVSLNFSIDLVRSKAM